MHRDITEKIIRELRTKQCLRDIALHWSFRSTVPGPGLRNVSEFLCRRHQENGIEAEVIPYPADDRTEWLDGHRNPLEWVPRSGRLEVVEPESKAGVICSYAEEPLSLICNSTATPPGGVDAPVVVIHSGANDEAYDGIDVSEKIVFTELPASSVVRQAIKRGAVGVISDCICPPWLSSHPPVREPEDAPDLTMWSIFSGSRGEAPLWGFSLSARQGRRLRKIIRESQDPVVLHAEVDADLIEGHSELVNALLPGTDLAHEEIWVLAHSSEPGARDNASGCCLAVELARVLKKLTENGKLPPLRRSIRFMNAVEVSGFLPYIDSRRDELDRVIAGLCLDSVGQDFSICGGGFVLFQSPEANASFVDGLMEHLFASVAAVPIGKFSSDNYSIFPWHTEPFWGNDAFVSDGFFDIPTPQMSTWPDKFYHSSMDTPDQMSENVLGRAGAIAGTFLYMLATAGSLEAMWFAGLAARDWKRRIVELIMEALKGEEGREIYALGCHLGFQGQDAVKQVLRFAPDDADLARMVHGMSDDMKRFAADEADRAAKLAAFLHGQESSSPSEEPGGEPVQRGKMVIKRIRWRTPPDKAFSEAGQAKIRSMREHVDGNLARIWNWINGRRTIGEIWERLQFGGAIAYEIVAEYVELLVAEGFAKEVPNGS